MNSLALLLHFLLLLFVAIAASPLSGNGEDAKSSREQQEDVTTTTTPSFGVQRQDSPIERIEIRLIDDEEHFTTSSSLAPEVEKTMKSEEQHVEIVEVEDGGTKKNGDDPDHEPDEHSSSEAPPSEPPLPTSPSDDSMYRKVEYVVQQTPEPIVIGADPSYFTTMSSEADEAVQAKVWVSVAPTLPKFDGDIDEDDLPPSPDSGETESEEPEEECLANKEKLTTEVIEKLNGETANYHRLVRQRNEQQKEFCGGPDAADPASELHRRCASWRAEKLVYYYKLMRKTYCQVDNWPNSPKIKKTYGEYLNLFGTFYAFQK